MGQRTRHETFGRFTGRNMPAQWFRLRQNQGQSEQILAACPRELWGDHMVFRLDDTFCRLNLWENVELLYMARLAGLALHWLTATDGSLG